MLRHLSVRFRLIANCQNRTSFGFVVFNFSRPSLSTSASSVVADNSFAKRKYSKMSNKGVAVETSFPVASLVPKAETGALNFLQKYPEFNGRDVTIAIFDSGVDPRAAGLQTTLDGAVKVIERFDCSGCGDTDMTKKVVATGDGTIAGLSGRLLKLTPEMLANNKDGKEFRVGLKSLFDLYPSKIRENVSNKLKRKIWDEPHKVATAEATRQLTEFELNNSDLTALTLKDKLQKENFENSLEFLNNLEKKYMSIKTTFDCILYPTEGGWQAVIDTTEKGDLQNAVHIAEYSKSHEVKNVDEFLSVSVNIHDVGNVLEIVGMCSSHGTHVASIASGNHLDKNIDGLAPNAKIVSLTIGEGRLGSMETGTALVRAMMKVMELCNNGTKIDVINMSYGEHAHWSSSGRIGELMNEVVNKYGVVWVASAGNHGPALCTVGTPPDITPLCCIGVGAYVSPQMMEAEYALREKLPANVYTWTSRDPCIDGGRGVTVCAPGAAITSVPEFTMSKAQLMNGTSMAAPHAAGAIGLLISGLKQKGVNYSPYSIKRAICATATYLSYVDQYAQGSGLLNIEKAFEHLVQYANQIENQVRFNIGIGKQNAKGIHLRCGVLKKPSEHTITIEPVFFNEQEVATKDKTNFNVRLSLIPSEPWVQCGGFLDLCHSARSLVVKVDPVGLPPGVHSAFVNAYDTNCVEKGTLFEIPITVVQPHTLDVEKSRSFNSNGAIEFKPNTIQRDFILVPNNATWAVLRMKSVDESDNQLSKFYCHTMQILPNYYCKALETEKLLVTDNQNETIHAFECMGNNILELCIAKYWSNFGTTHIKYSLEFHGLTTRNPGATQMVATRGIHRIEITSLGQEDASPSIQLKSAISALKPSEAKISALSPTRDVIPSGRQIYQNLLTYNLHIAKAQEISIQMPLLASILYESEFESQFWMLFDSNKMLITCGDAYTSSYVKLEKGEYSVRLQVRHERKECLEKVAEANLLVCYKLASAINLDVFDHFNPCVVGGKKMTNAQVVWPSSKVLYVAPMLNEKLSKASVPAGCSQLQGVLTLPRDEIGRKVNASRFVYMLGDFAANGKKANGNGSANGGNSGGSSTPKAAKTTSAEDYKDGLRDYQCSMIPKLDFEQAEQIYMEITAVHPKHLNAHLLLIQNLESNASKIQYPLSYLKYIKAEGVAENDKPNVTNIVKVLKRIVSLADIVINETDKNALLAYYGLKCDSRSDAAKIKGISNGKCSSILLDNDIAHLHSGRLVACHSIEGWCQMDKQKTALLDAYVKKGIALCKLQLIENNAVDKTETSTDDRLKEIDAIFAEIPKYIDPSDLKVITFSIWHAQANTHYGRMAKALQKVYDDKLNREILEELSLVAAEQKLEHVSKLFAKQIVSANPMGYRLF